MLMNPQNYLRISIGYNNLIYCNEFNQSDIKLMELGLENKTNEFDV